METPRGKWTERKEQRGKLGQVREHGGADNPVAGYSKLPQHIKHDVRKQ